MVWDRILRLLQGLLWKIDRGLLRLLFVGVHGHAGGICAYDQCSSQMMMMTTTLSLLPKNEWQWQLIAAVAVGGELHVQLTTVGSTAESWFIIIMNLLDLCLCGAVIMFVAVQGHSKLG